jgi:hypothetical protein
MTNRFNKHNFIENQAKLDIFDNFLITLWRLCDDCLITLWRFFDNFFGILEHSFMKKILMELFGCYTNFRETLYVLVFSLMH